jgi:hypothetical protein
MAAAWVVVILHLPVAPKIFVERTRHQETYRLSNGPQASGYERRYRSRSVTTRWSQLTNDSSSVLDVRARISKPLAIRGVRLRLLIAHPIGKDLYQVIESPFRIQRRIDVAVFTKQNEILV